jgi:hypothetical protein
MSASPAARPPLPARLRRLARRHRPLAVYGAVMALATAFFVLGAVVDERTVTGAPAWLKPAKFGVSITVYVATILWMLAWLPLRSRAERRWVRAIGWILVATLALEIVAIAFQAARGVPSHFHVATPFDAAVWGVMAGAIGVLLAANLALAVLLLRRRFGTPSLRWSLRLGLAVSIVGMAQAYLMTWPTAQQMASWEAGAPVTLVGAHAVGVPDGGEGLPVLGWSREGGDLRVGHFVGLHALQGLPLIGLALRRRRRLDERGRTALVAVAGAGWLGATALVTWQALRGQPLLQPDALTLAVAAALALAVVAAAAAIASRSRRRTAPGGGAPRPAPV